MPEIALLVLEKPWNKPKDGARRVTVLPFFEGLERIHPTLAVYYSTYHNLAGMRAALDYDLRHTTERRQILYIGSHGQGKMLDNIRMADLLKTIHQRTDRIEGVIISSCEVCGDPEDMMQLVRGTSIKWALGYKCAVNWFDSTMVEMALVNELLFQTPTYKRSKRGLEAFFINALGILNAKHPIENEGKGTLADNLAVVLNPSSNTDPIIFHLK